MVEGLKTYLRGLSPPLEIIFNVEQETVYCFSISDAQHDEVT